MPAVGPAGSPCRLTLDLAQGRDKEPPRPVVNTADVDDVVAVEVRLADGGLRYFLTWGRIQDVVDPEPVCELVLRFSRGCALGGVPVSARVCDTLREAADSPTRRTSTNAS